MFLPESSMYLYTVRCWLHAKWKKKKHITINAQIWRTEILRPNKFTRQKNNWIVILPEMTYNDSRSDRKVYFVFILCSFISKDLNGFHFKTVTISARHTSLWYRNSDIDATSICVLVYRNSFPVVCFWRKTILFCWWLETKMLKCNC